MQAFPPPGTGGKIGSDADAEVEKLITTARQDKKAAQIVGRDALTDKITGSGAKKPNKTSKRSKPDVTGAGGRNRPTVTGGKDRSTDDSKLVQQTLPGMEGGGGRTRKKRSDAGKKREKPNRRRYFAEPGTQQLQLDLTKKAHRKQVQQDVAKVVKNPRKTAGAVLQRTFLTKDKGVRGLLKNVRQNPIATAVVAGVARDSVRNPLPQLQMPTVKGGKVGKRTAG